jgi:hypothetical protein
MRLTRKRLTVLVQVTEREYGKSSKGKSMAMTVYDAPLKKVFGIIRAALEKGARK